MIRPFVCAALSLAILMGCAAADGDRADRALKAEDPERQAATFGPIKVGASRSEVQSYFGAPVSSVTNADGTRKEIYEGMLFNTGEARAPGGADVVMRGLLLATFHGLTLGLFGESYSEKITLAIAFDSGDRVISVEKIPQKAQKQPDNG